MVDRLHFSGLRADNYPRMLEDAFSFTAEELALNRDGQLSAPQEDRLQQHREVRGCGRRAAAIGFGLTAFGLILVPVIFANEPGMEQARPTIWGVAAFVIFIALLFSFLDIFAGRNLTDGTLSTMEGAVETWSKEIGARSSKIGTAYYLRVGPKQFQLTTKAQFDALNDYETYRFYYVANGRVPIIMSVEPVDLGE